jgi:hypothetical protein
MQHSAAVAKAGTWMQQQKQHTTSQHGAAEQELSFLIPAG